MRIKVPNLSGKKPGRWVLPAVLLGVYLFLKLQGWSYGFRANSLEQQLEQIRPVLSAIVLAEQMESVRRAYAELCDKAGRLDIKGSRFLQQLSRSQPAVVTIERIEVTPEEIQVHGILRSGIQSPEEILSRWNRRMGESWREVQVQGLAPDSQAEGAWRFQLKAKRGSSV